MTTPHKWTLAACVLLAVFLAVAGYELVREHDARTQSDAIQAALAPVIKTAEKDKAQAEADKKQIAADADAKIAAISAQRVIVVTPQQAAAVANTLPNLPQQVTVQQVPATATAPATSQIVVPAADIPAFQKYKLDCDESNVRLSACALNSAKDAEILKDTETQLSATQKERDSWEKTAKGGSFWTKLKDDAIKVVIFGGVGYMAGKYGK